MSDKLDEEMSDALAQVVDDYFDSVATGDDHELCRRLRTLKEEYWANVLLVMDVAIARERYVP